MKLPRFHKAVPAVCVIAGLFAASELPAAQAPYPETVPVDKPWWREAPYRLEANGAPIDTGTHKSGWNGYSHAAASLGDVLGDGLQHLVVGSFSGQFLLFRNIGEHNRAEFTASRDGSQWLKNVDGVMKVFNYCCAAVQPQVDDIDGDGIADLSSGSYGPNIYWFKGLGGGKFDTRRMLTDQYGIQLSPRIGTIVERGYDTSPNGQNLATSIAWTHGFADRPIGTSWLPLPDMVIGNAEGAVFIAYANGPKHDSLGSGMTPIRSQPTFKRPQEILIDGKRAIPDEHATPAVIDWDNDDLMDIVVGSMSGTVYLLRNSGTPEKPEFKERKVLLGPGRERQWLEPGEKVARGTRSYVQFARISGSPFAPPSMLVGDWSHTLTPRPDLTRAEKAQLKEVQKKLAEFDKRFSYTGIGTDGDRYSQSEEFRNGSKEVQKEVRSLQKELESFSVDQSHGFVWVYPR